MKELKNAFSGAKEAVAKTDKALEEELSKEKRDAHRIARLYEQKLLQGGQVFGGAMGKYRSPW